MMFRASDIVRMAEKRGYDLQVVSENVYMLRKQGDGEGRYSWAKMNGHACVQTMSPIYYYFRTKKR